LQRSQACPVLVDDWRRFLTELEKSSGFVSDFGSFAGVPDGDPDDVRFGGIGDDRGTEDAVRKSCMAEAEEYSGRG
jgi:hypothetical protein